MIFSTTITGKDAIVKAFQNADDKIERNLIRNIKEITLGVHAQAITQIQKNSAGTPAVRYNPKRNVHVSRPGESPNTDTGTLVKSIGFEFVYETAKFIGRVGTNLVYGAILEKKLNRPWLLPALKAQQKFYIDKFKKDVKDVIKSLNKSKGGR